MPSVENVQLSVGNLQFSVRPTFITDDAAVQHSYPSVQTALTRECSVLLTLPVCLFVCLLLGFHWLLFSR